MMPLRFVVEGDLASLYRMVCVTCMCGTWVMELLKVPLFASARANLLS